MIKKFVTLLLICSMGFSLAHGQSVERQKRLEPIVVPPPPKRVEFIEIERQGPSYFQQLCMDIADLRPEPIENCEKRLKYKPYNQGDIIGEWSWDWRKQYGFEVSPELDFNIELVFSPENMLFVRSCYAAQYYYYFNENSLDRSLTISTDWDVIPNDNCDDTYVTQVVQTLLEFLIDGCGISCNVAWRDDDLFLVNRNQKLRMHLTKTTIANDNYSQD